MTANLQPQKLTNTFVQQVKPLSRRIEVRDQTVPGLVLRVQPSGKKSFYLQTRFKGSKLSLSLGNFPAISLAVARELARLNLEAIARGEDPRERRRKSEACAVAASVTLRQLVREYEIFAAPRYIIWRENGRRGRGVPEARASIYNIFSKLLDRPVSEISAEMYAREANAYRRQSKKEGKATANGAASRALQYIRPVLDWAAGRGRYRKKGAGREFKLDLPVISDVQDPSEDDPTLLGVRERVLRQDELERVLPLLQYPAPAQLGRNIPPELDFAPIALRFLLLTLSRLDEVVSMRVKDVDRNSKTWTKEVKTNYKEKGVRIGQRKKVTIPLSQPAWDLLTSLPSFREGGCDDFVFPSSRGGALMNWSRVSAALHAASSTSGWHRHDMRRTAATLLNQLLVSPSIIDRILCHANPLKSSNVSGAAVVYILSERIIKSGPEPERDALNLLAEALASIECRQV